MNVFGMYVEHGKKPGFWIRRNSWGNTCAKVTSVGDLDGPPPYYGDPEVRGDVFDIVSGEIKEANAVIRCPGTYAYAWIDPPTWSGEPPFDPLADRIRLYVPFKKNSQAKRLGARWSVLLDAFYLPADATEAIAKAGTKGFLTPPPPPAYFRAPYERREEIKSLGGRWDPKLCLWAFDDAGDELLNRVRSAGFELAAVPAEAACTTPADAR